MRADHAVVEILKREGVTTLFCFPTTSVIETAVAGGLRPIICRQERVGVDMADGYARVTNGRPPGVFAMQYGPGAENAFPGIATTYSDSVPVLFLPLGHAREQAQVFPMFHSSRTYASVTKQAEQILVPEQVPAAMRRALQPVEERPAGTGDGGAAARPAGARHRHRHARSPAGAPDAVVAGCRMTWRRRRGCWWMRRVR